ncbi:hypothetical protein JX580_04470 [Thiomicrospira microaerophila]|uniref:hypothetical protein n=1 Tax=Thiomicrospira microaerophila TaxID=406020 RepID=UPI00200E40B4|nr:hypothetical protein [Thiomicrospira microaerophila]UQB43142.1 hypothetical protein JX580_04470 [Thiomicrospira microaerophila]
MNNYPYPTDQQIKAAIVQYSNRPDQLHEHPDCVKIAFAFLDAQKTIKGYGRGGWALKHIIEAWAGRYVSTSDVEVAARLHPSIKGTYPDFNLSARLTLPCTERLSGIGEAFTQSNYTLERGYMREFKTFECGRGNHG